MDIKNLIKSTKTKLTSINFKKKLKSIKFKKIGGSKKKNVSNKFLNASNEGIENIKGNIKSKSLKTKFADYSIYIAILILVLGIGLIIGIFSARSYYHKNSASKSTTLALRYVNDYINNPNTKKNATTAEPILNSWYLPYLTGDADICTSTLAEKATSLFDGNTDSSGTPTTVKTADEIHAYESYNVNSKIDPTKVTPAMSDKWNSYMKQSKGYIIFVKIADQIVGTSATASSNLNSVNVSTITYAYAAVSVFQNKVSIMLQSYKPTDFYTHFFQNSSPDKIPTENISFNWFHIDN